MLQESRRWANQARRRRGDRATKLLYRLFHGPAWLTFPEMGLAAGAVALCSFNLFELFRANFRLLTTYGLMAASDGGALQLVELAFWGYLGLACYVIFKDCLDGLLTRFHRSGGASPR
jgi:hypothetical protein